MNRINQLFKEKKRNITSIYFTAGYPHLEDTVPTLLALEKQGVDLVEIGIPFSDPIADGPVIQQSSMQALQNGMSLSKLFSQLQGLRQKIHIPLLFMGYFNAILQYGFEEFCQSCRAVGVDGVIIPDLPFEEYEKVYKPIVERYDLSFILLITPETSEKRIRAIDAVTHGFIYMVSSASTTGTQATFNSSKIEYFKRIRSLNLKNPCLIGFGISNKSTLEDAFEYAQGAIIGSKFISLLSTEKSPDDSISELYKSLNEI